MSVGQRIRKIREMRGWTQQYTADKSGIHKMLLQKYEYGSRHPKPEQLQKLATAFEIDIAFLQPSTTDTRLALYALLFDLMEEFDDIVMRQEGDAILFGIDHNAHRKENLLLARALEAHSELSAEEFVNWLISYGQQEGVKE